VLCILLTLNRNGTVADLTIRTHDYGYSTVYHVARSGHLGDLAILIDLKYLTGMPVCLALDLEGYTPLWFALHSGHLPIICHLLTLSPLDANIRFNSPDNLTPPWTLTSSKHASPLTILTGTEALLSAGVDLNACNT
jgi:hypothetical protein